MSSQNKPSEEVEETSEKPQVYAIYKDPRGWKFNRRDFLAAASAVAATTTGCTPISPSDPTAATKQIQVGS